MDPDWTQARRSASGGPPAEGELPPPGGAGEAPPPGREDAAAVFGGHGGEAVFAVAWGPPGTPAEGLAASGGADDLGWVWRPAAHAPAHPPPDRARLSRRVAPSCTRLKQAKSLACSTAILGTRHFVTHQDA